MRLFLCLAVLALSSCRQHYQSPVKSSDTGYLVVEGYIDCGEDSTVFRLSRSVKLDSFFIKPASGARVLVESKSGRLSGQLSEISAGLYSGKPDATDLTDEYRLHIFSADGSEYASDYCVPKKSPPIDSISWAPAIGGINVYVSSHDPANQTIYYRWQFDEAWRYTAPNISSIEYVNGSFRPRPPEHQYYTCYHEETSGSINVAATDKFSSDIISAYPLNFVSYSISVRLSNRYGMKVTQTALSPDAFNFFTRLKKNTQELGSVFDAQPSTLTSNIHGLTDPGTVVIGEVYCSSTTTQSFFIDRIDLPPAIISTGYEDCGVVKLDTKDLNFEFVFGSGLEVPLSYDGGAQIPVSTNYCADCRFRGGTLRSPDFWR